MSRSLTLVRRILANDLRVYFRSWQRKSAGLIGTIALQALFLGGMHLVAVALLSRYQGPHQIPGGAELVCLFIVMLITVVALQRSLEVLYNRGDLPMLLASPAPLPAVVFTRLVDIQLTTLIGSGLITIPLVDAAAWLYGPQWWWGGAGWLAAVLALAPGALLLTLLTVRGFGPRRARVLLQVGSLGIGMIAVLGTQVPYWIGRTGEATHAEAAQLAFFAHFDVAGLRALVAAAQGDVRWLSLLLLSGAILGAGAWRRLTREFASGAQAAASDVGETGLRRSRHDHERAWSRTFRDSRTRTIIRKELRLVWRDPLLLVRGSAQLMSFVPALAGVLWFHTAAGLAAFALLGPPILAVTLASMMTLNDEAHGFVASSPLSPRRAAWARTTAAATPPIVLAVLLASFTLILHEPVIALVGALGGVVNAVALAWVGTCTNQPLSAEDRASHRRPKLFGQYLFAMLVGGIGAGAIAALAARHPLVGGILCVLALASAGSAFTRRPKSFAEQSR